MCADPKIQMFITAVCAHCVDTDCAGALNPQARDKCGLYDSWLKLSPTEQSKKFLAATAGEIILIEELTK